MIQGEPAGPSGALAVGGCDPGARFRSSLRPDTMDRPPLLLFNGISANLELAEPLMRRSRDLRRSRSRRSLLGAIMVPGRLSVFPKLASPRRYTDKSYMKKIAPQIYGGASRENPELIGMHAGNLRGASYLAISTNCWL
jgi:hypothetical protein